MGLGSATLRFTALHKKSILAPEGPRWNVIGRSNVGKSSLLNAMVHPQRLFKTGKTPGVTIGLISVNVKIPKVSIPLELIDMPGFGFSRNFERDFERWEVLALALQEQEQLKPTQWIWLMDPHREPEILEEQVGNWLGGRPFLWVFTKADKIKKAERAHVERRWTRYLLKATEKPFWCSSKSGEGMALLQKSAYSFVKMSLNNL